MTQKSALSYRVSRNGPAGDWYWEESKPSPHRRGAGWRTHRSLPRRRADRGTLESLRPPEWADRRGAHHRRLRDLPVAWLPVPAGGRLRAAAVHREARHLPRAHCAWRGRGRPAPAAAGYGGGGEV